MKNKSNKPYDISTHKEIYKILVKKIIRKNSNESFIDTFSKLADVCLGTLALSSLRMLDPLDRERFFNETFPSMCAHLEKAFKGSMLILKEEEL